MATAVEGGKTTLPDAKTDARFPADLIDPEVKRTKAYGLQYFKAAYNIHKRNGGMYSVGRREDWITNRMYAEGNQSTLKYINWLTRLKDEQNRPASYLDLDWSIVSLIPKFRDVVLSTMEKMDYDIYCDAINPLASIHRAQAKAQIWARSTNNDFFKEMSDKAGVNLAESDKEFMPKSKEELEVFMTSAFRLSYEAAMEMAIQGVKEYNKFREAFKTIRENIFDLGCAGACVEVDRFSNAILYRATDPVNMVLMDFKGHDGSAMSRIGEIRIVTIGQLRLMAGDQFTEEQYHAIAQSYCGYWSNPTQIVPFSDYINTDAQYGLFREYDNFQIFIMDMDFDSVDRYVFEKKQKGQVVYNYRKPFNTKTGNFDKTGPDGSILQHRVTCKDVKTVYTGKWIIGTDFLFDYGVLTNISRDKMNPNECMKRYKFYRVSNKSMLERLMPYADSAQLTWLKIQNLKARAMPKGIMIEIGAFENVFLDGKKMTAQELLEMAVQSGIIVYRRVSTMDDDGIDATQAPPIQETTGGMGPEFNELLQSLMNDIQMMREVSGINEIAAASDPDPNQPVGTAKMALASANNAIYPLISGFVALDIMVCKDILAKINLIVKYTGKFRINAPVLGEVVTQFIEINMEDSIPYVFNVRFQARPTEEGKARLMQAAQIALQSSQDPTKGGIEFTDYLEITRLIENNYNMKFIEMILAGRISKYKKQSEETQARLAQASAQASMQAEQAKMQAEQAKMQAETVELNKRYAYKIDQDIRLREAEAKLGLHTSTHQSMLNIGEKTAEKSLETQKAM